MFIELWTIGAGSTEAQRESDDLAFRRLATKRGLRVRLRDEALGTAPFVLVGLEFNRRDLATIDMAIQSLALPLPQLELMNLTACNGPADFERYLAGIGRIPVAPFVSIWTGSCWTGTVCGGPATKLLRQGLETFVIFGDAPGSDEAG